MTFSITSTINCLKIQRALHLFQSPAWYAVSVYHRSPYITVTKQCLDRPYIVVGLQEMSGKRVAECVRCDALRQLRPSDSLIKSFLNMCFMQMIPPVFPGRVLLGQLFGRKKPLIDKLPGRIFILLLQCVYQKYAGIFPLQVLLMKVF